jgi:acyl-CoA thioesterase FadM
VHIDLDISHRPHSESRSMTPRHVPFYLALEVASDAWARALATTCDGILTPSDLGVVNVTSDFSHEAFTGEATFDVALERVGTTSLTFAIQIVQHGHVVGALRTTLVRVDELRDHALPWSHVQRAALEELQRR